MNAPAKAMKLLPLPAWFAAGGSVVALLLIVAFLLIPFAKGLTPSGLASVATAPGVYLVALLVRRFKPAQWAALLVNLLQSAIMVFAYGYVVWNIRGLPESYGAGEALFFGLAFVWLVAPMLNVWGSISILRRAS